MQYRRTAGRLVRPGDVLRIDGRLYKIDSIAPIWGRPESGILRAHTITRAEPRPLLLSPADPMPIAA